jgi:hypothetical protein
LNRKNHLGDTAILNACKRYRPREEQVAQVTIMVLLLRAGARLDIENDKGETPLTHGEKLPNKVRKCLEVVLKWQVEGRELGTLCDQVLESLKHDKGDFDTLDRFLPGDDGSHSDMEEEEEEEDADADDEDDHF